MIVLIKNFSGKITENSNGHKPVQSLAWDKYCRPKCEGGLGTRKTEDVNSVFLGKHGWKNIDSSG